MIRNRSIRMAKRLSNLIKQKSNYHKKQVTTLKEIRQLLNLNSRQSIYMYLDLALNKKFLTKEQYSDWRTKSKKKQIKFEKSYCKTQISLKESKQIVRKLGIKSVREFYKLKKQGHPNLKKIPSNPDIFYGKRNLYKKQ